MDKMDIWDAIHNIDPNVNTFMVLCYADIEKQRQALSILNDAGFIMDRYATNVLEGKFDDEFFNPLVSRVKWDHIDVACANDGYRTDLDITYETFMDMFGSGLRKELEPIDMAEFESALNEMIFGV